MSIFDENWEMPVTEEFLRKLGFSNYYNTPTWVLWLNDADEYSFGIFVDTYNMIMTYFKQSYIMNGCSGLREIIYEYSDINTNDVLALLESTRSE